VRVLGALPQTAYERPNSAELRQLFEITCKVHPDLRSEASEKQFSTAFYLAGFMFRLVVPGRAKRPCA
jgi:hypothetical protein